MDILFLHVPKFKNHYKPIDQFTFINLPPVGLLGLADYLRQNQYETGIIHLGVERQKYGILDFEKIIAETKPAIIGLGLHWHFQSYDVIEVARKIKRSYPEIAVLLGGFTASYFADAILKKYDCIDFIIRGDSEIPLVEYLNQYHSGKNYHGVPNLAFRENGIPKLNPIEYVADQQMLNSISFTDFSLMKDWPVFVESFSRYVSLNGMSPISQKRLFGLKKMYPVLLGRGCVFNCSYCGGAADAQKIINNRTKVCFRSVDSVLTSLEDLQRFGFEATCLALDARPSDQAEDFYIAIFEGMNKRGISLSCEVERYTLPTRRFLRSFRESGGSFVTISPNSHSEALRKKNGFYRYSNKELEACLQVMEEEDVSCALFFAMGLPFESESDLREMLTYQQELKSKFKKVSCKTSMIEIEPCSPMSRDSKAYEIVPHRTTFEDYHSYHSQSTMNHYLEMGYDRTGCAGNPEMANFFCRNFCSHGNFGSHIRTGRLAPFLSRAVCGTMSVMWKMGAFQLVDRILSSGKP